MTGYGTSNYSANGLNVSVEVKTLNSKFLDLNLRLPRNLNEKEYEIRQLVTDHMVRGKVNISVEWNHESQDVLAEVYDEEKFITVYNKLKEWADKVGSIDDDLMRIALSLAETTNGAQEASLSDEDAKLLMKLVSEALEECDSFRVKEGAELLAKFKQYAGAIGQALEEVKLLDPDRVERIRTRIESNLMSFADEENLDKNRLEQEILYYIEKLDITEEKVRLQSHLEHFEEVLDADQSSGKKLGFISQEIGREINTIGSKANDAAIQKHVVQMKEELEKIKEQVLNVV